MLPMNATPLNERLILTLIDEHQAGIRRCFVPLPAGRRAGPSVRSVAMHVRRRSLMRRSVHCTARAVGVAVCLAGALLPVSGSRAQHGRLEV